MNVVVAVDEIRRVLGSISRALTQPDADPSDNRADGPSSEPAKLAGSPRDYAGLC